MPERVPQKATTLPPKQIPQPEPISIPVKPEPVKPEPVQQPIIEDVPEIDQQVVDEPDSQTEGMILETV